MPMGNIPKHDAIWLYFALTKPRLPHPHEARYNGKRPGIGAKRD